MHYTDSKKVSTLDYMKDYNQHGINQKDSNFYVYKICWIVELVVNVER